MILRALALAVLLGLAAPAQAADRAGLSPLIGARVDPAAVLTGESGERHAFAGLLAARETLLVLGYHRCPNLCGVIQQQLADTLSALPAEERPFVLFASLDPGEGPADARAMRTRLAEAAPGADLSRWRFLTGSGPALAALSRPLGMQTYVRPGGEVIVHPAAVAVLTPEGALSEVFYGFEFGPDTLSLALRRAADGHVGGLRERVVLLCAAVDEAVGRVARGAWAGIRALALATVAAMAAALFLLWRREAR